MFPSQGRRGDARRKQPRSAAPPGAEIWPRSRTEGDIGVQLIGTCALLLVIAGSCCLRAVWVICEQQREGCSAGFGKGWGLCRTSAASPFFSGLSPSTPAPQELLSPLKPPYLQLPHVAVTTTDSFLLYNQLPQPRSETEFSNITLGSLKPSPVA